MPVKDDSESHLLKGVSRSFYLSLRLLPAPMRGAASLGYLLARTSDTLADTASAAIDVRVDCLDSFARSLKETGDSPRWPLQLLDAVADPRERLLLEHTGRLIDWLQELPAGESELIREVTGIIISGQKLDLERFAGATGTNPVALEDDADLEDYAWRVAGCVGAFWTKLGFLSLGDGFSSETESVMIDRGVTYGKGLQLVNILRDLPEDLSNGRCYLPVPDPTDTELLMAAHARWLELADTWIGEGFNYAASLPSHRLRAASVLPAMIARETTARMRGADFETLRQRVKIRRTEVYLAVLRAFGSRAKI
jgi:farnesyl-diphosphate farnesyltransferase